MEPGSARTLCNKRYRHLSEPKYRPRGLPLIRLAIAFFVCLLRCPLVTSSICVTADHCKLTPVSPLKAFECLAYKELHVFGDSNIRRWFKAIASGSEYCKGLHEVCQCKEWDDYSVLGIDFQVVESPEVHRPLYFGAGSKVWLLLLPEMSSVLSTGLLCLRWWPFASFRLDSLARSAACSARRVVTQARCHHPFLGRLGLA